MRRLSDSVPVDHDVIKGSVKPRHSPPQQRRRSSVSQGVRIGDTAPPMEHQLHDGGGHLPEVRGLSGLAVALTEEHAEYDPFLMGGDDDSELTKTRVPFLDKSRYPEVYKPEPLREPEVLCQVCNPAPQIVIHSSLFGVTVSHKHVVSCLFVCDCVASFVCRKQWHWHQKF